MRACVETASQPSVSLPARELAPPMLSNRSIVNCRLTFPRAAPQERGKLHQCRAPGQMWRLQFFCARLGTTMNVVKW